VKLSYALLVSAAQNISTQFQELCMGVMKLAGHGFNLTRGGQLQVLEAW